MSKFIRIGALALVAWCIGATLALASATLYYSFDGPAAGTQSSNDNYTQTGGQIGTQNYNGNQPGLTSNFNVPIAGGDVTLNVYLVENLTADANLQVGATNNLATGGLLNNSNWGLYALATSLVYPNGMGNGGSSTGTKFIVPNQVTYSGQAWINNGGTAWSGSTPGEGFNTSTAGASTFAFTGTSYWPGNPQVPSGSVQPNASSIAAAVIQTSTPMTNSMGSKFVYFINCNGTSFAEFLVGSFDFTNAGALTPGAIQQIDFEQYYWSGCTSGASSFRNASIHSFVDNSGGPIYDDNFATANITVQNTPEPPSVAALLGMVLTGGVLWFVHRRRRARLAVAR